MTQSIGSWIPVRLLFWVLADVACDDLFRSTILDQRSSRKPFYVLLILLVTMIQWQQYLNIRRNGQRRRQQWSFLIHLLYLCATLHRIKIVVAFNNRQRLVSPTRAASVRDWGTSYRQKSFVTLVRTQQQHFIRHQMQHSDATSNSKSSLPSPVSTTPNTTTNRNEKKYDLGVGKHPPLNSDTNSTTSLISSVSSSDTVDQSLEEGDKQNDGSCGEESSPKTGTALNARLIGMNWMAPESVVKPMIQNNTTINGLPPPPPDLSSWRQTTETKSRRMVAYVV